MRYLPLLWPVQHSGAGVEHNDVILTLYLGLLGKQHIVHTPIIHVSLVYNEHLYLFWFDHFWGYLVDLTITKFLFEINWPLQVLGLSFFESEDHRTGRKFNKTLFEECTLFLVNNMHYSNNVILNFLPVWWLSYQFTFVYLNKKVHLELLKDKILLFYFFFASY